MKKAKQKEKDELRLEYKRSDFSGSLARGKYAKRIREASNIVVLKPEVARLSQTKRQLIRRSYH